MSQEYNASFSKTLLTSNINQSYLGIPRKFREEHLPWHDATVILVDENEHEFFVSYSFKHDRLVHGWHDFVIEHDLLEGDNVVLNLIGECRFKVVINRESSLRENEFQNNMPVGFGNYKEDLIEQKNRNITGATISCQKQSLELYNHAKFQVGPKGKIRKMNSMVKLQCGNILRELTSHPSGGIFNEPVDPVKLNLPEYFSVIKEPMDLGTVKHKLDGNGYSNKEEFAADVKLTFSNAILFNPPGHEVYKWAELCRDHFKNKWRSLESKIKRGGPTTASDGDKDSGNSVRKRCEDNRKGWEIVVRKGAGKVHPVKVVENQSKFAVNNVQKGMEWQRSVGRSSEHNICGDSKVVDRLGQIKKRAHEMMAPREKEKNVCSKRTQRSTETNGANGNSNLNAHASTNDAVNSEKKLHEILDVHQATNYVPVSRSNQVDHRSSNLSKSVLSFKDVKGFKDFKIHSNGKNLDSEIPLQTQRKYYELCCTQKEFLHAHITQGLNKKIVAEMITDTVSIAEATRAATLTTSPDYLEQMGNTLKFFECCGMTVGFLRVRLHSLVKRSREYLNACELKKTKLFVLKDEKKTMHEETTKVEELRNSITARGASIGSLEAEIGVLEEKIEELDKIFKKVADSPFVCLL